MSRGFIATRRLKQRLSAHTHSVLRLMHGTNGVHQLPYTDARAVACAVRSYYMDPAHVVSIRKTWRDAFRGVFEEFNVPCVESNCLQALEQTVVCMIENKRLALVVSVERQQLIERLTASRAA